MATTDERLRRPNSFGDAAAASLDSRVAQIPTGGMRAPAADGSQDSLLNTDAGRNLSNLASALPGAGGVPGVVARGTGLAARALGASAPAVTAGSRLAQVAAPYAPAAGGAAALYAASSPASAPVPTAPPVGAPSSSMQRLTAPAVTPSRGAPNPLVEAALTSPQAPAQGAVTREGNSYSGTNISGDITINGQAPRNGGAISPQNMAAADGLAARALSQAPTTQQIPTSLAVGVSAPTVLHSGNSWQARNDLRNLEVAASSITNQPGFRDTTQAWSTRRNPAGAPTAAIQAYQTALAADIAARGAQPGFDMAAARENAATQREGLQQAGATARATLSSTVDQQRLALEQERDSIANRAARQLETQRAIAVDPRSTPEQRSAAERALLTLQGKQQQADPYLVVPGGQQVDEMGRPYNMPSSVFNRQTGQFLQQPGQGGGRGAPQPGTMEGGYRFKGGDPADSRSWERV
ncbi:MAG: hypothetical protein WA955_15615 [Diaphorobacter nitroreducens]|uniref:hypothetical protein n=1 Tax=Diaphorobacter nitroreducens TaxID=164759 RepID=UPI003C744D6B